MILKALYDYYDRCKGTLPAFGRELKEIGFLVVIDRDGNFLRFEDRRINNKQAQTFIVKKQLGRTSAPLANYLYDSSAYVFGFSDKKDFDGCRKYLETFKKKVEEIYKAAPDNADIMAVHRFYQHDAQATLTKMKADTLWPEIEKNLNKKYSFFSFLINGDTQIVAEKEELLDLLDGDNHDNEKVCLVSGKKGKIVDVTTATMIQGSQAVAKIVSFQVKSGYDSYGKEQGANAPISEESEFAYSTALKHLLRSDSRNKFLIGNRTFLFWASKDNEAGNQAEKGIFDLFGFSDADEDDPNARIEQVRKVFKAIYSGELNTSLDDKFYILGLAPNSARIAVVYWAEIPLKEFAERINRHFEDMEIEDTRKFQRPYVGLYSILKAVTLKGVISGNDSKLQPNLPEAVMKSIFQGTPYPQILFTSCIRRMRSETAKDKYEEASRKGFIITRVAIIKAYLNRQYNINEQKINVMLDKNNTNPGYLCGRLFAVLDKIQEDANNQHTIRERYMNSASATPSAVFATILNLSSHHSEKLNEGRNVFFEKLKQEIIEKLDADGFPAHLDLQDQGRFFVGYYHQRQAFFIKNEKEENNNQ
ncbi:MAG: type I-C CRISPR-associated protein Cas8c/Csd1 [Muribaculaceae bacterium]|nr:type I-C CRISPR-associated protein Cas8c/Csd1 [Muribaculaceae bacterium]